MSSFAIAPRSGVFGGVAVQTDRQSQSVASTLYRLGQTFLERKYPGKRQIGAQVRQSIAALADGDDGVSAFVLGWAAAYLGYVFCLFLRHWPLCGQNTAAVCDQKRSGYECNE